MNKVYSLLNDMFFEERKFEYTKKEHLAGFERGDYAFVSKRINNKWVTQLWIIDENKKSDDGVIYFKNLYKDLTKGSEGLRSRKDFIALKLFKITKNLLSKVGMPNNIPFIQLELVDNQCLNIIKNEQKMQEYINNPNNYRKIIICDSKSDVDKKSTDIQLYWENEELKLIFDDKFMDNEIRDKYNFSNFKNGANAGKDKGKLYKGIMSGRKFFPNQIEDISLNAFYDLFISTRDNRKEEQYTPFIKWLRNNDVKRAFNHYNRGIREIEENYGLDINKSYMDDHCEALLEMVKNDYKKELDKNTKHVYNNWRSYLKKYVEYLDWKNNFSNDAANNNENNNDQGISEELEKYIGTNTIFYGVPGCGKSHKINDELLKGVDGECYKRILFHPEYSYNDFVGQIRPDVDKDGHITYPFVSGPFTQILCDALKEENKNKNYFLVIEEINRGNAPAIFGDVFQLLDRNENGESEYVIDNADILKCLIDKGCNLNGDKIKIPSNLTIFATMNTSDQNVFVMDTAFKRRWHMERIANSFTNENPMGKDDAKLTIKDGNGNDITIKWSQFMIAVNDEILEHCKDEILVEDKLLGTNFVKPKELESAKVFADKVFEYLWNDVVKYNKEQLFNKNYKSLDKVIDDFCKGNNVFNDNCTEIAEIYKKQGVVNEE